MVARGRTARKTLPARNIDATFGTSDTAGARLVFDSRACALRRDIAGRNIPGNP